MFAENRWRGRAETAKREPEHPAMAEELGWRLLFEMPSLRAQLRSLALAAAHDIPVMLTGETGTGKTYLARLIHECSPRRAHPFLVIPCGALTATLLPSELFGHACGAFTGAHRTRVGKLEAVGQGTLLVDEIDILDLGQQAHLLRVVETGAYEPVGSSETRRCTARIIAASNCDLEDRVNRGTFRRDLYHRLNVLPLHLPPLRERSQEIAPLVFRMIARFAAKFDKGICTINPEALKALQVFPWPGNIRQLENAVQQAVLRGAGRELLLEHLPQPVQDYRASKDGTT